MFAPINATVAFPNVLPSLYIVPETGFTLGVAIVDCNKIYPVASATVLHFNVMLLHVPLKNESVAGCVVGAFKYVVASTTIGVAV